MRHFLSSLAVLALIGASACEQVTMQLMQRAGAATMSSSLLDETPDGLHVVLCGAGSPLPDPNRSGPCTAVIAGDQLFIFDVGSGASRQMGALRIPQGAIDAIFLTHFHSDHIDGLGELLMQRWVNGTHTSPTPIYGPAGVESVVAGFNEAYSNDKVYRVEHHGEETVPPSGQGAVDVSFVQPPNGHGEKVFDAEGVTVTAFRVDHAPIDPAVGYRVEYAGRSVVISGDTSKSANLEQFAKGADLLVHEALSPRLVNAMTEIARSAGRDNLVKITQDILDYHASPVEAAESAQAAGVSHLLYYHVVPPLILPTMNGIFLDGTDDAYDGPITLGTDGTMILLEAGGDSIEVKELL
jgi:ribonuclease Z